MDIVIPLGTGSKNNNLEIRYALRSIEKNISDWNNIFIIGEDPGFIKWSTFLSGSGGIYYIPYKDNSQYNHEKNIYDKIVIAAHQSQISDEFFFTNDDIFFILPINITNYPYFYNRDLKQLYLPRPSGDVYRASLKNAYTQLSARGLPTKHFDVHFPIIYNKKKFLEKMSSFNWTLPYGSVIKSLYCNALEIPGEIMEDCKIDTKFTMQELDDYITGRHAFSVGDKGITNELKLFLKDLFPSPSRFETTP